MLQRWYKHKISDCKPSGNQFFVVSCWKVFVSFVYSLNDPIETEPLEYSEHGRRVDIASGTGGVKKLVSRKKEMAIIHRILLN